MKSTVYLYGAFNSEVSMRLHRRAGGKKNYMPVLTKSKEDLVLSHPTMCLHCHLIVEMFHQRGADPVKGAWNCPRCGHKYPFTHWKIKKQVRGKSEAA